MDTDSDHKRASVEQRALADVVIRLQNAYPDVPPEEIEATVHGRYAHFEGSRVRDFIAVLVERHARQDLRNRAAS
ncbi:MAG TPA: hypothetical protein VGH43_05030 [Jatrophihabitans sp.]